MRVSVFDVSVVAGVSFCVLFGVLATVWYVYVCMRILVFECVRACFFVCVCVLRDRCCLLVCSWFVLFLCSRCVVCCVLLFAARFLYWVFLCLIVRLVVRLFGDLSVLLRGV